MRVLAFDPGAERLGWGSVGADLEPYYHMSGILPIPRGDMDFQEYRLEMEATLTYWLPTLFDMTEPEAVVNETVPAVGGGNFVVATQSYLVNAAVSTIHTIAFQRGLPVHQISARTTQKLIAIKGKGKKVTKPQVRNGVLAILPELIERKSDWVKVFDEPDAIATGLAYLGLQSKDYVV